jgi:hypothetical protein
MSELVKAVMTAINTCEGHDDEYRRHAQHVYVDKAARAAIKAIAEWLGKVHGHNGCASKLLAQLEDRK